MDNFVTIRTFSYAHEVAIVRGRLEAEGIECFTQDELTVQVNPFYSNAIGGIKLQVRQSDLRPAIEIMEEGGYQKESHFLPTPLYTKLDNATFKVPLLRGLPMELRLLVIVAVVMAAVLLIAWVGMER